MAYYENGRKRGHYITVRGLERLRTSGSERTESGQWFVTLPEGEGEGEGGSSLEEGHMHDKDSSFLKAVSLLVEHFLRANNSHGERPNVFTIYMS